MDKRSRCERQPSPFGIPPAARPYSAPKRRGAPDGRNIAGLSRIAARAILAGRFRRGVYGLPEGGQLDTPVRIRRR